MDPSTESEGRLIADHSESVGDVGESGTSGAGERLREPVSIWDSCADFRRTRLGVDRAARMPTSLGIDSGARSPAFVADHVSGMPALRFVLPTFLMERKAWLARMRNVLDFFKANPACSLGEFDMPSLFRTLTTSTTSSSSIRRLRRWAEWVSGARSLLLRGITMVSCDSFPDDRWNTGAGLPSVCW